ncbi:MAG TPA: hypothetical protein P5199_12785 [Thermoanaerobaculia bacterium]|nr:hypothetical protein [Thermoleophilia bacterium]HRS37346.1 hypothetical protein [Thermoanaerobaculia bacterium]
MSARHEILRRGRATLEVLCPFTRGWAVGPFFDALEASDVPLGHASFLAYVDSDDEELVAAVRERLERLPCPELRLHVSGWAPPDERAKRRTRHAAMRLATQGLVGTGRLLLLEDDTIVPAATYRPLQRLRAAWAVGVQVGRWGQRCLGLWHVDQHRARTLMPGEPDELCNATGFYCVLTTGSIYRSLDMWHWDDVRGHDVSVTSGLRGIAIAWDVETGHLTRDGVIGCDEAAPYEVEYHTTRKLCAAEGGARRRLARGSVVPDGDGFRAASRIYGLIDGRQCLLFTAGASVPADEVRRLGLPTAP